MKLVPIKFIEVEENKAILTLQLQSGEKIPVATFDVDYFIKSVDEIICGWDTMTIDGREVSLEVDWYPGEITSLVSDFDRRNGGV